MDPEARQQHQRKQQACDERTDVIEREHSCHQLLQVELELQQADQNGDFEPHQRSDEDHDPIKRDAKGAAGGIDGQQQRRTGAPNQGNGELDLDETLEQS